MGDEVKEKTTKKSLRLSESLDSADTPATIVEESKALIDSGANILISSREELTKTKISGRTMEQWYQRYFIALPEEATPPQVKTAAAKIGSHLQDVSSRLCQDKLFLAAVEGHAEQKRERMSET